MGVGREREGREIRQGEKEEGGVTHWDFQGPQLTTQLTVELHGNLGGHTHQVLLLAQGSLEDALGGDWQLHTAELLD